MPLGLLVVHAISLPEGIFGTGYPEALFQGRLDCQAHDSFADLEGVEVSAHVLIDRAGTTDPIRALSWAGLARRAVPVAGAGTLQRFLHRYRA